MCVYVSSGSQREGHRPPNWGTSLFAVLKLLQGPRVTATNGPQIKRLGAIVSNIYNSLRTAAQKALEAKREQRYLAQAISHEFKNLNQDVANLAGVSKNEICKVPNTLRGSLSLLEAHLDALQMAARATTYFCLGTYWLFSNKDMIRTTTRPDDNCYLFRHITPLALRLVARSKPNWKLVGIPTEAKIINVLGRHFGQTTYGSLADLVLQPAVAVMLFLVLEPVRNIRANTTAELVEVRLKVAGKKLTLTQTTFEQQPHGLKRVKSGAVEILMQALADYCPWNLLHIDHWTEIASFPSKKSGQYRVLKNTTITVPRIITEIRPGETGVERRI